MDLQNLGRSAIARIAVIGFLILLLLLPLSFIKDIIYERQSLRQEAISDITSLWGSRQTLTGPFLRVPYEYSGPADEKGRTPSYTGYATFLPEKLEIDSNMATETRKRGIYEAVLYTLKSRINGTFHLPDRTVFPEKANTIHWNRAVLLFAANDTRGVRTTVPIQFSGNKYELLPGTESSGFPSGMHIRTNLSEYKSGSALPFSFELALRGSEGVAFTPVGKMTRVTLTSDWKDPSFRGAYLPESRQITGTGFEAKWEVSYYGRNYPQVFFTDTPEVNQILDTSSFGAELLVMVDTYRTVERSVKYSLLFIFLTFSTFFLFEVLKHRGLHAIQYGLIGGAIVVFYLLFLSLSEHIPFLLSYFISSVAVILLISAYSASILKDKKNALIPGGLLSGLYIYLYVVLQSQDYALLLGSAILFALLATVMYLTRNVDWKNL